MPPFTLLSTSNLKSKDVIISKFPIGKINDSTELEKLDIFLDTTDTKKDALKLSGVTNVIVNAENTLGKQTGLSAPIIQPWYFTLLNIEISGTSYMGAYSNRVVFFNKSFSPGSFLSSILPKAPGQDYTIKNIYNNYILKNTPGSNFSVDSKEYLHLLKLENNFEENNSPIYIGFITKIRYEERADKAFCFEYYLTFEGVDSTVLKRQVAASNGLQATHISMLPNNFGQTNSQGII